MRRRIRFQAAAGAAAVLAALPFAAPAGAATAPQAAAFKAVLDCKGVADSVARLACYDAAAARMGDAERRGDIVVIDKAQATAAHRQAFGLPLPSLDFITRALSPEEAGRVEGLVRGVSADANGRWTMSLEDGAIWRQIDGQLFRPPHAGSKVTIRNGSLGSFLMNIDGQTAVKVHRDR